jgi:4-amino-4-deoxy-L-arabinose transferase-like glycosyltransferase
LFLYAIDTEFVLFKYVVFANQIAQGQDLGERFLDLSPFYLTFMTIVVKTFNPDYVYIKFIQAVVGVMNCLLLFTIGKKVLTTTASFIGALLYAVYGNIMILETTFEPFVFVLLFNLVVVYCLLNAQKTGGSFLRKATWSVWAGLFTGVSILTKPNFLLFLPFGSLWLLLPVKNATRLRQRCLNCVLFMLIAASVVSPVTIRNYLKFDDIVLVTADYGKVFFHGNARTADGFTSAYLEGQDVDPTGDNEPDYAHVTFRTVASQETGRQLRPSEAARFWFLLTLRDIATRPFEYLLLELKKVHLFFHTHEMHLVGSAFWEYTTLRAYPFIRYGMISSLALIGMFLARRQFIRLFLLYGVAGTYFLSNIIFLVTSRYRGPAVPYLCLFAGYALSMIIEEGAKKHWKTCGIHLVVFLLLLAANVFPYRQRIAALEKSMREAFINSVGPRSFESLDRP